MCGISETLDFKFLLKSKYNSNALCVVEEGPNRQLIGGALQGDARQALFRISSDEVLEYRVFIKADRVSPFDLAASWRAYQENLRPSAVRGIPDVSIGSVPETGGEVGSFLNYVHCLSSLDNSSGVYICGSLWLGASLRYCCCGLVCRMALLQRVWSLISNIMLFQLLRFLVQFMQLTIQRLQGH